MPLTPRKVSRSSTGARRNDTESREFVELLIGAAAAQAFQYAVVPGLKFRVQALRFRMH
jgi:hypothetical protein